jgi:hypothetical protein
MSKIDKLKARLLSKPKDFTYQELVTLFEAFGFEEKTGRGSARKLINPKTGKVFNLHQPHPGNILKGYVIREAIEILKSC